MRKLMPILLLIIGFFSTANAQVSKLQPFFIYNFIKQIEWPSSTGDFVIGVVGQSEITAELVKLSKTKKVNDRKIVVKHFSSVSDISACHILFVPASHTSSLQKAIEKLGSSSTLVITEAEGAISQGAAINFVIRESRQRFQVSKENASKKGVKISSYLIKLAVQ